MPELPVKEVRLPELHLPEITREEILRTLSEVRRPEIDLSRIERPRLDLARIERPRMNVPRIGLPSVDLAGLVATAIATVGIGRPRIGRPRIGRPRWALIAGLVAVVGVVAFVIVRSQATRARTDRSDHLEVEPDLEAAGIAPDADEAIAAVEMTEIGDASVAAQKGAEEAPVAEETATPA